jgi:hypothetical protein
MDLSLLETLKHKLTTAKEFSPVFAYFLDHFGEEPAFIALGERTDSPFLEAMLAQIGEQMFGRKTHVRDVLLTRLSEQQFIHGTCTLNGKLTSVLYFEDIRTGLLAVIMSITPSDTKLVRFTGRPMPGTPTPSAN